MFQSGNLLLDLCLIVVLIFSVVLHEIAHGYVAYRFGDWTAKTDGRLSLNPLVHIDPIGTIALPVILMLIGAPVFGWAKPVPVNWNNLRGGDGAMFWVAAAGIIVNLSIALIGSLIIRLLGPEGLASSNIVSYFLIYTVSLNILLALFNLVPIPPLDGSRLLRTALPPQAKYQLDALEPYGIILVFGFIALLGSNLSAVVFKVVSILTGIS